MGFQLGLNGAVRKSTGITPWRIHRALKQAVQKARIVDGSLVWMVLDDQKIPPQEPPAPVFITVRYPSFVWENGDVFTGDNSNAIISELRVRGQTRHTLWLYNELDVHGTSDALLGEAYGKAPDGNQYIGQMMKLFWEQDLMDENGNAITSRPMRLISVEVPPDVVDNQYTPFRITWEISFVWDLSQGG